MKTQYLSLLMKLKKNSILIISTIIMLVFTNEASAKWSVCCMEKLHGGLECIAVNGSCSELDPIPIGWSCKDLPIVFKPSNRLNREKGNGASFEIDGKIIKICSDACESFLLRKHKDSKTALKEFETFMKTDRGFVSDKRLNQISKELGIPITYKK